LNQPSAVPMIVMTRQQDHVETINKTLRNAGHPVHLSWLPEGGDLGDALTQLSPDMLVIFADENLIDLKVAMDFRNRFAPDVPVVVVRDKLDEDAIADALELGADDAVTLEHLDRFRLVIDRELKALNLQRSLKATVTVAGEYQRQLNDLMQGSADAIAQVQEGIIVDANPAWLELFGKTSAEELIGTPLMDEFDEDSHPALKGAIVACLQDKWPGHALRALAELPDGTNLPLDLTFSRGELEGEPCVRVTVTAGSRDRRELEARLQDALQHDTDTGFLNRGYFLEELRKRLTVPLRAGVRHLLYVEPDKQDSILSELGAVPGEEFLIEFAHRLRESLQPGDLAGRFAGNGFMILLQRGNTSDVQAWAEHVVHKTSSQVFQVGERSLSTTCTVGMALVPPTVLEPEEPAADAFRANRRGRELGGNRVSALEHTETLLRMQDSDKLWVRRIKAALMENRFRLMQQPIASLMGGDEPNMFDVVVRMLDEQGDEVLPSEFMTVAERNDLTKNIDRWVVGASMSFCAARKPAGLFVRLSKSTLADSGLAEWLLNQLKASKIDPARIIFQVHEDAASGRLKEAALLREKLSAMGFRLAIEGFGGGRDSAALITHLKPDFVKIHGALMQGLSTTQEKQQRVKELVELARKRQTQSIAERVEDANTMAVLWQLGVEYIQGFFVNAPEAVVLG
jgi:diguanylate cyclase (GGDEF)-like protein/PAS domain S-box-containing protein